MAQLTEEQLLQVIKKDDINSFNALMDIAQCGSYRLGRFPVLSLLYLYNSRKILFAHEEQFLKISEWEELREPAGVSKLFSEKAGKCLRLYLSEVVSPIEMLLVLDKVSRLKKVYPQTKPSEAVKKRLKSIYYVKYSLGVKFEGNNIILDRRPLSRRIKKRIIAVCVSCFFVVAVSIATPVTLNAFFGPRSGGDVTRLSHIKFGARTTYTLQKDITIPKNYSVGEVNCTIIGNGHKLIFGEGASMGQFNGKMSDMEIQTSGTPIFRVCTSSGVLSDVTVNVNTNVRASQSSALIAVANYGTLDGITMNVSGNLSAVEGNEDELIFGGMVATNYNVIANSTVNYSNFTLEGETLANATFGGIVGVNDGIVKACTVTGEISASTFDLAGVCYINYNELNEIVNEADLSQTSSEDWYPIVGGIAVNNLGLIAYCQNTGDIAVEGQYEAICGGIAARAYLNIAYCVSSGNITVSAPTARVGGIFGLGGVATNGWGTYYYGQADHCIAEGKISFSQGEGTSYIGGIGGYIQDFPLDQSNNIYMGYSVLNCIFMGEVQGDFNYFGNIVGVCGENIYKSNSYTSNGKQYRYFENNYYIENALPAFGAVERAEDEYETVAGKEAYPSTEDEIKNTEAYKDILKSLGK